MSLAVRKASFFVSDFEKQFEWYARQAGWGIAEKFLSAVDDTIRLLSERPALGRSRNFRHKNLKGIRSYRVNPPFDRHLIFYRHDASWLSIERLIHGARDLPHRLTEPPES
jgi:toxin ParE1/3/4